MYWTRLLRAEFSSSRQEFSCASLPGLCRCFEKKIIQLKGLCHEIFNPWFFKFSLVEPIWGIRMHILKKVLKTGFNFARYSNLVLQQVSPFRYKVELPVEHVAAYEEESQISPLVNIEVRGKKCFTV
jgi:hypothetical protein